MSGTESYEASFARFLEGTGGDGRPIPDPTRRPSPDDEDLGPSLFRTFVEDCVLQNLNLPGLFIGRSEIQRVNFSGSVLRLSTFAWNDFIDCRFEVCDLSDSDLRASHFVRCDFSRSTLIGSDLRHSSFEGCRFDGANTTGLHCSERLRVDLGLTPEQTSAAIWSPDDGPEPAGG